VGICVEGWNVDSERKNDTQYVLWHPANRSFDPPMSFASGLASLADFLLDPQGVLESKYFGFQERDRLRKLAKIPVQQRG
jgi:hypothetical protein